MNTHTKLCETAKHLHIRIYIYVCANEYTCLHIYADKYVFMEVTATDSQAQIGIKTNTRTTEVGETEVGAVYRLGHDESEVAGVCLYLGND